MYLSGASHIFCYTSYLSEKEIINFMSKPLSHRYRETTGESPGDKPVISMARQGNRRYLHYRMGRDDKGMDIKEAATMLDVSETTIRRWIKSGRLEAELQEGPYGPQYFITPEDLEKAKNYEPASIVIQNTSQASQLDLQMAIQGAISEALTKEMAKVEEGIQKEIDSLKSELEDTRKALAIGLEERDKKLIEVMRSILEHQREEYERREREKALPWWKKVFKRG